MAEQYDRFFLKTNNQKQLKMSNIMNNRVNTVIPPAEMVTAQQHFTDLRSQLPFLIGLAMEEKTGMIGIQVDNKHWVEQCIVEMEQDPSWLPPFLSVTNVKNDLNVFHQLEVLKVDAQDFVDRLSDTQFLAGAEAYSVCLIYYKVLEAAARAGVPGADERYNRLKGRFAGQGPQGGSTPTGGTTGGAGTGGTPTGGTPTGGGTAGNAGTTGGGATPPPAP
jgi:hypothetical protein